MASEKDITISQDVKDLVVERIDIIPPNVGISIGSTGTLTKKELIEHVKKGDAVGKKIIEVEMNFLKALKDGTLLKELIDEKVSDKDNG
jgi:hypothetical protein